MNDTDLPAHTSENRRHWDAVADDWVSAGERAWASAEARWGVFRISEAELKLLPEDMTGLDTIELGCGTAYFSAWLARRGARVVGIDNSERQLATARFGSAEDASVCRPNGISHSRRKATAEAALSRFHR